MSDPSDRSRVAGTAIAGATISPARQQAVALCSCHVALVSRTFAFSDCGSTFASMLCRLNAFPLEQFFRSTLR